MFSSLRGKSVIITGAASGIGLATAERFRAEEARIGAIDIDEAGVAALRDRGVTDAEAVADVSDHSAVTDALTHVASELGGVDVLIANAGISVRQAFVDVSPAQWRRVLRCNLDGVFHCAQWAARRMLEAGRGIVLMTASTNGLNGHRYYSDYNASKAGVILLAKSMALELAPVVRVNAVCPGYIMTPMQRAEYTDQMIERVNEGIPLCRHGRPEEVAGLFAFLASSEAEYITGQSICIDGGETI